MTTENANDLFYRTLASVSELGGRVYYPNFLPRDFPDLQNGASAAFSMTDTGTVTDFSSTDTARVVYVLDVLHPVNDETNGVREVEEARNAIIDALEATNRGSSWDLSATSLLQLQDDTIYQRERWIVVLTAQ